MNPRDRLKLPIRKLNKWNHLYYLMEKQSFIFLKKELASLTIYCTIHNLEYLSGELSSHCDNISSRSQLSTIFCPPTWGWYNFTPWCDETVIYCYTAKHITAGNRTQRSSGSRNLSEGGPMTRKTCGAAQCPSFFD